jgi:hypothetical protein
MSLKRRASKASRLYEMMPAKSDGQNRVMDECGNSSLRFQLTKVRWAEACAMEKRFVFWGLLFLFFSSLNSVARRSPAPAKLEVIQTIDAPQLQIALEQSARTLAPGGRLTLAVELRLGKDMHVYAPGAPPYKPLKLIIDTPPEMKFKPAIYPKAKILDLPAINERVPVFDGTFRISEDVQVSSRTEYWGSLGKDGKLLTISGTLDYQACDNTMCYIPNSIPVKWQVQVLPRDRSRTPTELQHK